MKNKCYQSLIVLIVIFFGLLLYEKLPLKIPCFFELITGYYCPGCGLTRALFALLHGDIEQAFAFNYLVMILLPFFLLFSLHHYFCWLNNKIDFWLKSIPEWFWYSLLIIAIIFAILRNLPSFWFFAPHII